MTRLIRIGVEDLDQFSMKWLQEICAEYYTGESAQDVMKEVTLGLKQLWVWGNTQSYGLVVTETRKHPAGEELVIWGVSGKGWKNAIEIILSEMREIAKRWNCKWVLWHSVRPALFREYEKRPEVKSLGRTFFMEVE